MPEPLTSYIKSTLSPLEKELVKHLNAIHEDEKRILHVLSVIYEPVTQTDLQRIIDRLEWKDQDGKNLKLLINRAFRDKLLQLKLLVQHKGRLACHHGISEVLTRETITNNTFKKIIDVSDEIIPTKTQIQYYHNQLSTQEEYHLKRYLRKVLYSTGSLDTISENSYTSSIYYDFLGDIYELCLLSFDFIWFQKLEEHFQLTVLNFGLKETDEKSLKNTCLNYLKHMHRCGNLTNPALKTTLAEHYIEYNPTHSIDDLLPEPGTTSRLSLDALRLCFQGHYIEAIPIFEAALKQHRKDTKKRTSLLPELYGVCFALGLVASDNPKHKALLKTLCKSGKRQNQNNYYEECYEVFSTLHESLCGVYQKGKIIVFNNQWYLHNKEAQLLSCLTCHWLGETPTENMLEALIENVLDVTQEGDTWYTSQALEVINCYLPSHKQNAAIKKHLTTHKKQTNFASILHLLKPKASWELALDALENLDKDSSQEIKKKPVDKRLIWSVSDSYGFDITPKEQKKNAKGTWSKGRNVALKRLHQTPDEFPYLSEHDKTICREIRKGVGYYGHSEYELPALSALTCAVNHPHIFWEEQYETPLEIISSEPELVVKALKKELNIQLLPYPTDINGHTLCVKDREYRLRMITFTPDHLHIAHIISSDGLTVPIEAKEHVLKSLNAIAPLLSIQSDIGGGNIKAQEREADLQLYISIESCTSGLKFTLSIRPLGVNGPQLKPNQGRHIVMAEVDGERRQAQRHLKKEEQQYQKLIDNCPTLTHNYWDEDGWERDDYSWVLDEEQSLETLYHMQSLEFLTLLWPEGGKLKFHKESDLSHMKVSIRQSEQWFALEGQLNLDDGKVIAMSQLMGLIESANTRFIKLNDDTFITLTEQLRHRLTSLKSHAEKQHYHGLALGALDELTEGMSIKGDAAWLAQKNKIHEAYALNPVVPSTLQAELRDYQGEGFSWLARLAHWGAGACLADDMGLGKTIQSLALLLTRANQGPSLILAPTSVCMNWINEAKRFAPTLKTLRFGGKNRQACLDKLGPFDLVVCSYGLLQTEQTMLQKVHWQCIVADEAQALKNAQTKRTKAAMTLNADFKMVTTGTPIENHLGELWTLFHFINPGLLGSLESFNTRFANPIQNNQDKSSRLHLKRLIQPFILRRLKTDVLTELPSRTEITIHVEQSDEEKVFYEALRQKAMQTLTTTDKKSGQLKVFAEIMRLRRACCHPKLVVKNSKIPSSKLAAFASIAKELIENKHRALVFSQFVEHLHLIREYLDEENISYQYLDGRTSISKREKAITDFQGGEGDLFLISLKAGGSGLNLTAADYVVHMDPWWNPAVEDQASDRAHRMGQTRPVTIYRLVTQNTIESKIIAMHHKKRDLADSLLEGSELNGKLSVKDIMGLIAQEE